MSGIDHLCKTCIRIRQGYCDGAEPEDRECQFYKRMTNADRIRQMSDEELGDFLHSIVRDWVEGTSHLTSNMFAGDSHIDDWLDWLKQEVEE